MEVYVLGTSAVLTILIREAGGADPAR